MSWSVLPTTEQVAGYTFTLEALPSFEAAWDRLHDEIGPWGDLRAREDLSPMFGVVWGAARVLAARLARESLAGTGSSGGQATGRRMLELGCGLALPSLLAARAGASVVASDQHLDAGALLERNLAHNGLSGQVPFLHLDWRDPVDVGAFDLVVASDVLYERALPERVAAMFQRALAPSGRGLLTDPGRPWLSEFAEAARAQGLRVEVEVGDDGAGTEAFLLILEKP